jgi:hypothetical protein
MHVCIHREYDIPVVTVVQGSGFDRPTAQSFCSQALTNMPNTQTNKQQHALAVIQLTNRMHERWVEWLDPVIVLFNI